MKQQGNLYQPIFRRQKKVLDERAAQCDLLLLM